MQQFHQSLLNTMLKNVSDPQLRETYGAILNGKFPFMVYCLSKKCKGKLIGYLDNNNRAIDEPTINKDGEPISGIETSRDRFDGRKGFKCYCGNDSILAEEEKGILNRTIVPVPPTRDDMNEIFSRLQKSKKDVLMFDQNHQVEYDGFRIKEII